MSNGELFGCVWFAFGFISIFFGIVEQFVKENHKFEFSCWTTIFSLSLIGGLFGFISPIWFKFWLCDIEQKKE